MWKERFALSRFLAPLFQPIRCKIIKKKRDFLTGDFQHFPSGFDWFGDFLSQSSYSRPGLLVSRHSIANLSTDQKIGDRSFRILAIKL